MSTSEFGQEPGSNPERKGFGAWVAEHKVVTAAITAGSLALCGTIGILGGNYVKSRLHPSAQQGRTYTEIADRRANDVR